MNKPERKEFSLYSWMLRKLYKKLFFWYFFTFLSSFFYYQAIFGLRTWSYKKAPYSLFFGNVTIKSSDNLLLYSFFCFFVGGLLTSLICDYLKSYISELCRAYLRKLILSYSAINPQKSQVYHKEILGNFLGETELFAPLFILVPQKIFAAIINIILNVIFLTNFRGNNFAISFVIIISIILAFLSFFAYLVQSKINQKQNKFRYQENFAMEKYLENKTEPQKVEKLINLNLKKTNYFLKKKTISYIPTLIIPGLNIFFCLVYSKFFIKDWKVGDAVEIYAIATSIQTIFWKIKDITDALPEFSKIKIYHKSLSKMLNKLRD